MKDSVCDSVCKVEEELKTNENNAIGWWGGKQDKAEQEKIEKKEEQKKEMKEAREKLNNALENVAMATTSMGSAMLMYRRIKLSNPLIEKE